jgi:hypothetical protein
LLGDVHKNKAFLWVRVVFVGLDNGKSKCYGLGLWEYNISVNAEYYIPSDSELNVQKVTTLAAELFVFYFADDDGDHGQLVKG